MANQAFGMPLRQYIVTVCNRDSLYLLLSICSKPAVTAMAYSPTDVSMDTRIEVKDGGTTQTFVCGF